MSLFHVRKPSLKDKILRQAAEKGNKVENVEKSVPKVKPKGRKSKKG